MTDPDGLQLISRGIWLPTSAALSRSPMVSVSMTSLVCQLREEGGVVRRFRAYLARCVSTPAGHSFTYAGGELRAPMVGIEQAEEVDEDRPNFQGPVSETMRRHPDTTFRDRVPFEPRTADRTWYPGGPPLWFWVDCFPRGHGICRGRAGTASSARRATGTGRDSAMEDEIAACHCMISV